MPLDNTDKKLLDIVQDAFPLTGEPYREMASLLGVSEDNVLLRLKRLRDEGIIRRMGAIFDSKKLGYCSTLCAMRVPTQRVDEVAQIVNEYPGVTHNYLRNDEYNVWFTITARSQQELDGIMDEIRRKSGIQDLIDLPAVRTFKIRVRFQMADIEETQDARHKTQDIKHGVQQSVLSHRSGISGLEKRIARELQGNIALHHSPFRSIADKLEIEEEELLAKLRELRDRGVIRRFSAILRHRNVGISGNAMGVWRVPEDKVEKIGAKMAAFPQVSHCYQRVTRPGWQYNVYTMIHGTTAEDCERMAELISQDTGVKGYRLVYSTRELKKTSMRYFTED
jgi:DNA-binding Lrp family transcriptional regulator